MQALIELEDRILERALASAEDAQARLDARPCASATSMPRNVLERLAEIGVLDAQPRTRL